MNGTNGNGKIRFDEVELDPSRRLLRVRGELVPLNTKAFDLLAVLIENRGRLVSKDELLNAVWAEQFVEENNLTVQISALRKALGEKKGEHRYILTVPGKGYEFVGEPNGNGHEVVVESREITRIVIDESLEATPPARLATGRTKARWLVATVGLVGIIGAGWYGVGKYVGGDDARTSLYSARRFLTTGVPQRVAISRDGKTLAYSRRLKGLDSLWLGDLASGTSIQLTNESRRLHEMLEFSPDGRTVYMSARDENRPEWTLMSISTFGGVVRDLIKGVRYFSISEDGIQVAYFKVMDPAGKTGLFVADTATGSQERFVYQPAAGRKFAMEKASWSPLGNAVAVALAGDAAGDDCDLYEVDSVTGLDTRLGTNLCSKSANFAWVRDGSGIALTGKLSDASVGRDAWLADAETWNLRRLTAVATSFGQYSLSTAEDGRLAALEGRNLPNISALDLTDGSLTRLFEGTSRGEGAYGLAAAPDGKVVFTVRVEEDLTIWEMAHDGSDSHQVFPGQKGSDDVQPNVTPDNRFIVFESNRSGSTEIWRANRDGSDQVQLTKGGENSSPAITRDGKFVLYSAKREGTYNIWRIPVAGGEAEVLTNHGCSWPDPSPDGNSFACATGVASDLHRRKILIYPINGGEPVRSLAVAFNSALYNRIRWSPDSLSVLYKDEVEGVWKQSIDGADPQRLPGFADSRVFHLAFDADGKLLFSGGLQMRQIVILEPPPK